MQCLFWRLCLDHVWPSCTLKPAIALKFLKLSQHGFKAQIYDLSKYLWGKCQHHDGTLFDQLYFHTSKTTEMFKTESTWHKACVYGMSILGDHAWPSFTTRPARELKISRLSKHGIRPMSMEFIFGGHFRTMFDLMLHINQIEN